MPGWRQVHEGGRGERKGEGGEGGRDSEGKEEKGREREGKGEGGKEGGTARERRKGRRGRGRVVDRFSRLLEEVEVSGESEAPGAETKASRSEGNPRSNKRRIISGLQKSTANMSYSLLTNK